MSLKVLITGGGGPSAISFIKSFCVNGNFLQTGGIDFFVGDMDANAAGLYLVSASHRVILPSAQNLDFIPQLEHFCYENSIDVLVPTVDYELLPIAESRQSFAKIGTLVLLTSKESLEICLDKYKLLKACENVVPVPRFDIFDEKFTAEEKDFPLFIKPRDGSGSRGILKVESLEQMNSLKRDSNLLIQEYLPGEEYSVDVLTTKDGEVIAAVPRERMKVDSGIAVTGRTLFNAELEDFARRVATQIGLSYTANIQFRRNLRGEFCLLEVNPRFPGTMPLTVASGVNMPKLSLQHLLGYPLNPKMGKFTEIGMVRYWEEKFLNLAEFEMPAKKPMEEIVLDMICEPVFA